MEALERALLYAMPNFMGMAIIIIMVISRRNVSLKNSEKMYFDNTLISTAIFLFVGSMLWLCECSSEPEH